MNSSLVSSRFLYEGGRIMSRLTKIVALLMAVFVAVPLLAAEGKKTARKKPLPHALQLPSEITLTAEQQKKLDELVATYGPKFEAMEKQRDSILSEEQRKAGAEARKAALASGKKGKDLQQAADEAMKLKPEQKSKLDAISKESTALGKEIREKLRDLLTAEQNEELKKLEQKKKEAGKK
jgi:hypothetical protein